MTLLTALLVSTTATAQHDDDDDDDDGQTTKAPADEKKTAGKKKGGEDAEADTVPSPDAAPKTLSESLSGVAKAEYEAGRLLFGDGDYGNAIIKFKKAHELSGDPRLLWNIAVCQKNLRRYSKMIVSVRRYRKEAASMLGPDDRRRADEIVETVKKFISELKVSVDQKGADVYVDGEKVATTPVAEKLFVDVGRRTISIKKDGYLDHIKTIEVPGATVIEMKVRMDKDLHRGRLLVVAPEGSLIWVDGKAVGQTRWEGSLKSGAHTLKVTGEGMQPFQQDVTVEDDKTRRIDVELTPIPADSTATILWIVGGVSLAAATAVTSAFLFEPTTNPPVEGSINPGTVQLTIGVW